MASKDLKVPIFHPTLKDCEGSWEAYITKIEPRFREVRHHCFSFSLVRPI